MVRLHFQSRPWDLYVAILYVPIMAAILLVTDFGDVLGLLLVLLALGYLLVAALFPANTGLDWVERTALSVGVGVAVVPVLESLLNFSPTGGRFVPMLTTISTVTILVGLAAWRRRMRLPAANRLDATLVLEVPRWREHGLLNRIVTVALAASIFIAAATLAYVVLTTHPAQTFTEFYILGPGGNASGYPTNLTQSEPGTVIIGIINHEAAMVAYATRVDLVSIAIYFNPACGCNQPTEVNRTTLTWLNESVGDGNKWSYRYTFAINASGTWKLQFLLLKNGLLTNQELHLLIRIS